MKAILKTLKISSIVLIITVLILCILATINFFKTKIPTNSISTDYEASKTLESLAEKSKQNTNGDLTRDQIKNQTLSEDCPTIDDIYKDIFVIDLGNYVYIYREISEGNKVIYPNVVFLKTKSGYMLDGVYGLTGDYYCTWTKFGYTASLDFSTDLRKLKAIKNIHDLNGLVEINNRNICGFASISMQTFGEKMNRSWTLTGGNCQSKIAPIVEDFTVQTFDKYFSNLDELELINNIKDKAIAFKERLGFWSSFIKKVASVKQRTCVIDVSNEFVCLIPESEQYKYPRTPTDDDASKTFKVYNCNKSIIAYYTYLESYLGTDVINVEIKGDDTVPNTVLPNPIQKISVVLNNKLNSNMNSFNITEQPVCIRIFDANKLFVKNVNFTTNKDLSQGKVVGLAKGAYTFEFISKGIMYIDSENNVSQFGSFTVNDNQTLILDYKYTEGLIKSTFILQPNSSVSSAKIDLDTNPVNIILFNDQYRYELKFNNSTVSGNGYYTIYRYIQTGTYTCTITSKQLQFKNIKDVTIGTNNYTVSFFYSVDSDASNENYQCAIGQYNKGDFSEVDNECGLIVLFDKELPLGNFDYAGFHLYLTNKSSQTITSVNIIELLGSVNVVANWGANKYVGYALKINSAVISNNYDSMYFDYITDGKVYHSSNLDVSTILSSKILAAFIVKSN